jgi:hypothetical protein
MKRLAFLFLLALATHEMGGRYLVAHDPIADLLARDPLAALLVVLVVAARIALFLVVPAWVVDLAARRALRLVK